MTETLKLSDLKAGDKVIRYSRYSRTIETIDAITPTGNTRVGAILYRPDGTMRTSGSYCRSRIGPFDADVWQECVIENNRKEHKRIVANFDWQSATVQQIEAAYAIIKAE